MEKYIQAEGTILHRVQAHFDKRTSPDIVHLVQYDDALPVLAVDLVYADQAYSVPDGAAVNIRLHKPDGTVVYNPAIGVSEDRTTAYIVVTQQMTTVPGKINAIIEIATSDGTAGTAPIIFDVDANPIQEGAIESLDEFLTVQELASQVQSNADDVERNKKIAESSATTAKEAEKNARASESAAAKSEQTAVKSAETAVQYSGNPPIVGDNGHWMTWDADAGEYVDTGHRSILNYDVTYSSVDEMEADAANQPTDTIAIIASGVEQESNAQIYIKRNDGTWAYLADLSGFPGVGIESIEQTAGDHSPGTTDIWTITLTDGETQEIPVYNGANGIGGMDPDVYDPNRVEKDIFSTITETFDSGYNFKRKLDENDDLDEITEDGIYYYNTASIPKNAPFENAGIIEVAKAQTDPSSSIQRVTRYGIKGQSAFRPIYTGNGLDWSYYMVTPGAFKTLWSGSWNSGTITVPGLSNYRLYLVRTENNGTYSWVYRESSRFRGGTIYTNATPTANTCSVNANVSGDTLTYVWAGSLNIKNGTYTEDPVSEIVGLL